MANSFEQELGAARGKRQFVARAANEFLALANHDLATVANISWNALVSSPAWCVLDRQQRYKLIEVCGALCIAPTLRSTVDGKRFKEFQLCVGDSLYQQMLKSINTTQAIAKEAEIYLRHLTMQQNIQRAGKSVLINTIKDECVRQLYFKEFGTDLFLANEVDCLAVYETASQLLSVDTESTTANGNH